MNKERGQSRKKVKSEKQNTIDYHYRLAISYQANCKLQKFNILLTTTTDYDH